MKNIDPRLCKPHFSTKIFKSYLYYLKTHYPDVDPVKLCEESGLPFEYIQNEDNWVSVVFERNFCVAIKKITNDPDLDYKVGLVSLARDVLGGPLYFFARNTLSLTELYRNVPRLSPMFNKLMDVRIQNQSITNIVYQYTYKLDSLTESETSVFHEAVQDILANTRGYFSGMPLIKDLPLANVELTAGPDGFTISVKPPIEYKIFDLKSLALLAPISIISFIALASLWGLFQGTAFTLLGICSFYFYKKYQLAKSASSQTSEALERIDAQFIEIQKTKIELQRKLQETTVINNVIESISKELGEKNVLDKACQSLTQELGYDRVIFMLVDTESEQIRYASSAGLDSSLIEHFKNFSLPLKIDSDDPRKLTNVFRHGKPLVISDVKAHLSNLLPESRAMLTASGSRSFICAPIETEQSKFGLIICDCYNKDKILGPADLSILNVVAKQIAQSLERRQARQAEIAAFERARKFQEGFVDLTLKTLQLPIHEIRSSIDQNNGAGASASLEKLEKIFEQLNLSNRMMIASPKQLQESRSPNSPTVFNTKKGRRILIIDDDTASSARMKNALSAHNFQVKTFTSGPEAFETIKAGFAPELVLVDVMMPIMTGYEFASRIRKLYSHSDLPIFFLHNARSTPDFSAGMKAGGAGFINKDLDDDDFVEKIKSSIDSAALTKAYARFVPWKTFDLLGYSSALDVKLGDGIECEMSVLFCDIRNFTTLCEQLSPSDVLAFLNAYLSELSPCISKNNGFIDSFIGDCIMAVFQSAEDAYRAAQEMTHAVYSMQSKAQLSRFGAIDIGIGINTGPLILGPIGFEGRLQITSISDSVNTASRVESLCKSFGASIILTEATAKKLPQVDFEKLRLLGEVMVKGKKKKTKIYEDYSVQPIAKKYLKEKTKASFQKAVELYLESKIELSQATFTLLSSENDDLAVSYYLSEIQKASSVTTNPTLKRVA